MFTASSACFNSERHSVANSVAKVSQGEFRFLAVVAALVRESRSYVTWSAGQGIVVTFPAVDVQQ